MPMSQPEIERKLRQHDGDLAAVYELLGEIQDKQGQHDRQFEGINRRFDSHDQQFDEINRRLDGHDQHFDKINRRLDGHDQHFDKINRGLDGHDQRFDRIDGQLAEVIGILRKDR